MKRVLNQHGWDEVTTKSFKVEFKAKAFQTAGQWVDFTNRTPKLNFGGRNHCERCGCKWSEVDDNMMTYFVMTDKGNKVLCEKCNNEVSPLQNNHETNSI